MAMKQSKGCSTVPEISSQEFEFLVSEIGLVEYSSLNNTELSELFFMLPKKLENI